MPREARALYAQRKLRDATESPQRSQRLLLVGRKLTDNLGPESAFSRSMAEFDDRVSETIRKAADSVSAAMVRRREAEARGSTARAEDATPHV